MEKYERTRRNVVITPQLMKRMGITAEGMLKRYHRKKYWIFWRIVWWYHHWKLKRLLRKRARIIERLAPDFVPEALRKMGDKYWEDLLKKTRGK